MPYSLSNALPWVNSYMTGKCSTMVDPSVSYAKPTCHCVLPYHVCTCRTAFRVRVPCVATNTVNRNASSCIPPNVVDPPVPCRVSLPNENVLPRFGTRKRKKRKTHKKGQDGYAIVHGFIRSISYLGGRNKKCIDQTETGRERERKRAQLIQSFHFTIVENQNIHRKTNVCIKWLFFLSVVLVYKCTAPRHVVISSECV